MCPNDRITTIAGLLSGILTYWAQTDFALPDSPKNIAALAGSAALALLGYYTNKR